jgi:hypothetical protein
VLDSHNHQIFEQVALPMRSQLESSDRIEESSSIEVKKIDKAHTLGQPIAQPHFDRSFRRFISTAWDV